jgi:hypothetical protein
MSIIIIGRGKESRDSRANLRNTAHDDILHAALRNLQ